MANALDFTFTREEQQPPLLNLEDVRKHMSRETHDDGVGDCVWARRRIPRTEYDPGDE